MEEQKDTNIEAGAVISQLLEQIKDLSLRLAMAMTEIHRSEEQKQ